MDAPSLSPENHDPAPDTPGAGEELPLHRTWKIWHNHRERPAGGRSRRGEAAKVGKVFTPPKCAGSFDCIGLMWRYLNNIVAPSALTQDRNLFIFQGDTEPVWEHPDNASGGRWTYTFDIGDAKDVAAADDAWIDTCLILLGETLKKSSAVTGVTATRRQHYIRVSVWTRDCEDEATNLAIGKSLQEHIPAVSGRKLEYQDHGAPLNTFRHVLA